MPVDLEMKEDGYLLCYKIADPWSVNELLTAYAKEQELRDSTPHTVHSLSDFTKARRVPKNWLSARSGPGLKHPRSGEMVMFGLDPAMRVLLDAILKISRFRRLRIFKTEGEAMEYAKQLVAAAKAEPVATVTPTPAPK